MASSILRVDVSANSRDFQLVALEPGLPMLDQQSVNSNTLLKWLGEMTAEPERQGDSVRFYVRDQTGGRPEEIECLPATEDDLQGPLRKELEEIQERLGKVKPDNSTEEALHRIVTDSFEVLVSEEGINEREASFFKYRVGREPWRLTWCWGYQRRDAQPAPVMICTDPKCGLLFLRRPGQSAECPGCSEASAILIGGRRRTRVPLMVSALLLLLLFGGLAWFFGQPKLVVTPGEYAGRAGSKHQFVVNRTSLFGLINDDVSADAIPVSQDRGVVDFLPYSTTAKLKSQGRTVVVFRHDGLITDVVVSVGVPENPVRMWIDPESISLAVGGTIKPKVMGEYSDGEKADLSDSVVWEVLPDGILRVNNGYLEGVAEGTEDVVVTYRATPNDELVEALTIATVTPVVYDSLDLSVRPMPLALGQGGEIQLDGVVEGGKKHSLINSSQVTWTLDPPELAKVEGESVGQYLVGQQVGTGTLTATFGYTVEETSVDADGKETKVQAPKTVTASIDIEIAPSTLTELVVSPEAVEMYVGSTTDLAVQGPETTYTITSDDPAVVEIFGETQMLVGKSAGITTVTVTQGDLTKEVTVTVKDDFLANVESIRIDPEVITVEVNESKLFAVIGRMKDGTELPISADYLELKRVPISDYASVDKSLLTVSGLADTAGAALTMHLGVVGRDDLLAAGNVVVNEGFGLALLERGFKEYGPIDGFVPQTVMIGGAKVVVRETPGGGVQVVNFPTDHIPYDIRVGDVLPEFKTIRGFRRRMVEILNGDGGTFTVQRGGDTVSLTALGGNPFESIKVEGPYAGSEPTDFTVAVDIIASAGSAGLQYRAYAHGSTPPETWSDAATTVDGQSIVASFRSGDILRGPPRKRYVLAIESRKGGAVQKHLFAFVLESKVRPEGE
jgi:hypothetical protein